MSDSDARAAAAVQLCCCWSIGLMAVSASPPARGGSGETHSSTSDWMLHHLLLVHYHRWMLHHLLLVQYHRN